jgi:hypothetical protein
LLLLTLCGLVCLARLPVYAIEQKDASIKARAAEINTDWQNVAPSHFTETWKSYAISTPPYGNWEREAGSWGTLLRPGADGAGHYHATPAGQTVWLRRIEPLRR